MNDRVARAVRAAPSWSAEATATLNGFAAWSRRTLSRVMGGQGSMPVMTAVMLPVLLMSTALGVEVTHWSATKLEMQTIADVSAWAGAAKWLASHNAASAHDEAVGVAETNGVPGGLVTAVVAVGAASDPVTVSVAVGRNMQTTLTRIFPSAGSSVTISAVAVAQIGSSGPQPCILELGEGEDGITDEIDLSLAGNATLNTDNCTVVANDSVTVKGAASIHGSGGSLCGREHIGQCRKSPPILGTNSGPIRGLCAGAGGPQTVAKRPGLVSQRQFKQYIQHLPGIYSSWDVHGTLNLAPGLYIVNGNISAGAQAQLVGAGVTIIMSGTLDTNGGSRLDLTAPRAGATAGIPGILFAGTNSFLGNSERPVAGVIYFPNADLKFGGTTSTGTSGTLDLPRLSPRPSNWQEPRT